MAPLKTFNQLLFILKANPSESWPPKEMRLNLDYEHDKCFQGVSCFPHVNGFGMFLD